MLFFGEPCGQRGETRRKPCGCTQLAQAQVAAGSCRGAARDNGNGRSVRNVVEGALRAMAVRVAVAGATTKDWGLRGALGGGVGWGRVGGGLGEGWGRVGGGLGLGRGGGEFWRFKPRKQVGNQPQLP